MKYYSLSLKLEYWFRWDIIYQVGAFSELVKEAKELNAEVIELNEDMVALPGFIDAHTHICFAGSRANDYAMRNAGKSYLEIAAAGGGIWDTVQHTRKASVRGPGNTYIATYYPASAGRYYYY